MVTHDDKAWLAEAIIRNRRRRSIVLPKSLFAQHPWDALPHLFVADARSDSIHGSDLAHLTGCSLAVMTRWIKHLGMEGLINGGDHGAMNVPLVLSAKALSGIEGYLANTQELAHEFVAVRDLRSREDQRPI